MTVKEQPPASKFAFSSRPVHVPRMGRALLLTMGLGFILGAGGELIAQSGPPGAEPPPPPPEHERKGDKGHDDFPRRSFMPPEGGPRGDRDRGDMFKELSEPDRKRVREAFAKVWNAPEVAEARERLMKANEEYREALHAAMKTADPEVVSLLDKIKRSPMMSMGGGHSRGPRGLPDTSDPDFPRKAAERLGMDLQPAGRPEPREFPRQTIHERLLAVPAVKEAVKRLQEATPEQRMAFWKELRDAYSTAAKAENMELSKGRDDGPPREGGPRHDGPPPRPEGGPPGAGGEGPRGPRPPE